MPLASAQDYKRIFDGDEGPNTGGMGSYSPVPAVDDARAREICASVHQPVLDELARRGIPFQGVLYAGLMMTADGPRVLEFNVRFGDPETQALLPRLRSDLVGLLEAATVPGGLRRRRARVGAGDGGQRRARERRLSGDLVARRRDHRASTPRAPARAGGPTSRTPAPRATPPGRS